MRCQACNKELSDNEATLKDDKGEFYDLCRWCLGVSYSAMLQDKDVFKWDLGIDNDLES